MLDGEGHPVEGWHETYLAERKANEDLEGLVWALRQASTLDQQRIQELQRQLVSSQQYTVSQSKLHIALQEENRKLRRMVRDVVTVFGENDE